MYLVNMYLYSRFIALIAGHINLWADIKTTASRDRR